MPCYVVEYLWHVLLGETGRLPWRSEDIRLPLALRFEGGRDTRALEATVAVELAPRACHVCKYSLLALLFNPQFVSLYSQRPGRPTISSEIFVLHASQAGLSTCRHVIIMSSSTPL